MENLTEKDFEILSHCPWCGNNINIDDIEFIYKDQMDCDVVKHKKCGIVFAKRRLNQHGLEKYWGDYYSRVHICDNVAVIKRNKMYVIDFKYINRFIKSGKVLDVGCGKGDFLKLFKENGFETTGVEYGYEAAKIAKNNYNVYYGEFPKIDFHDTFDLIVFRGVLQYVPDIKKYLDKATSLLNKDGYIFITAQPNVESLCFNLFKDNFTQPVTGADFLGFSERVLTNYFEENGAEKIGEEYFYESTPYSDIENDIIRVAKALEYKKNGKPIDFRSPAFYGNMMSLIYRKI